MNAEFWWEEDPERLGSAVTAYVKALDQEQEDIKDKNVLHALLYANHEVLGIGGNWQRTNESPWRNYAVTENVIASVIDTAQAMIAKNRPRATFQTDGADWTVQRRAKRLEHWTQGMFDKLKVYDKAVTVFRDAEIFGTGGFKICVDEGDIYLERVLLDSIKVPEAECRACAPRQLHQVDDMDRHVLARCYPKLREQILALRPEMTYEHSGVRTHADNRLQVIESWHLPSADGADDGRHTLVCQDLVLVDEEYSKDYFPFIFFHWEEPITGFYGKGLAERLKGIQLRINKLNKFVDRCQDLISVPRIFGDVGAKMPKAHLDNQIGVYVPIRGKPPVFYTPPAVAPETYQRLVDLKRSAYELAGVSMLSAQSKKPADLESAVALREFNDIETQRFAIVAQRYEAMFLEIAKRLCVLAKELYAGKKDTSVVFRAKKYAETIKWSEVGQDLEEFRIDVEAASILSKTPAGRKADIMDMLSMGMITVPAARKLWGHPDLEGETSLQDAALEDIEATIEQLLDGKFMVPEPLQDLSEGIKRVQLGYLKARRDGAPEDILELFRRWIDLAQRELQKTQSAMSGAQGAAPNAVPPGMPGAPPSAPVAQAMPAPPMGQAA